MKSYIHPPHFLIVLLFSSLAWLSGCSSTGIKGIVERPNVQVHKVELGNFNLTGGNATFVLDIQNPNSFPIPLAGFDYGLSLNGVKVADGNKEHRVTIEAGQSKKVSVPLRLSFVNMMNMIPGVLRNGTLNYELDGSIHLPWFNIPFQRAGTTRIR